MNGAKALVIGASRGIGRAVALELAARGCKVLLHYNRSEIEAKQLAEELASSGIEPKVFQFDVADATSCELALASELSDRPLDVLVYCAGTVQYAPIVRMRVSDYERTIATNLTGFFNVTRPTVRGMMRQRSGSIVAIGSVVGRSGLDCAGPYCATKAGLVGAVRSLAKELGPFGIRANVVAPGWIVTDMTRNRSFDSVATRVPLGRPGNVDEVAKVVSFLCSRDASYVTGGVVDVSGGLDM